jgi:molybdate/tungstate transport system substrate-binding protein
MATSRRLQRPPRRCLTGAVLACTVVVATACSSSGARRAGAGSGTAPAGSGPVNVLYAGSLVGLMEGQVKPGFAAATGYTLNGYSAGSNALASQIKGRIHAGDVFISANPSVNDSLEGATNGDWVSWYATYASSPLVLGYNPKSRFAADLKSEPWYDAITEPGFRIGSTDPATAPKGKLAAQALTETASSRQRPQLSDLAADSGIVFPEETLVGRLQAGQLDAGFFYKSEAVAAKIPTVPLAGVTLRADYTVTILNRAPHPRAAAAFVSYLLGPSGQALLTQDGYTLVRPPTVSGSGAPDGVRSVLPGR